MKSYQVKTFANPAQTGFNHITGRTRPACRQRFNDVLGFGFPAFSDDENKMLIFLAATGASLQQMVEALPGRSVTMCKYHLMQLKSQGRMTQERTGNATIRKASMQLERRKSSGDTVTGIKKSRKTRQKKNTEWTEQEDLLLLSLRDLGMTFREISNYLPRLRSPKATRTHYSRINRKSPEEPDLQDTIDDMNATPMVESEVQSLTNSYAPEFDTAEEGYSLLLAETQSSKLGESDPHSTVPSTATSTINTFITNSDPEYSSESEQEDLNQLQGHDVAQSRHVNLARQFWDELSSEAQESDVEENDAQRSDVQECDVRGMSILDQLRVTHPPQAKHGLPVTNGRPVKNQRSDLRERLQRLPEDIASIKERFARWHGNHLSSEERAELDDDLRGLDAKATEGGIEINAQSVPHIRVEDVSGLEGRVTVHRQWEL